MVNLNELEADTRVDVVSRSESTAVLVDMRPILESGSNQETDQVKFVPPKTKMTSTYYQCRAGRDANFRDKAVEIANKTELGHVVGGRSVGWAVLTQRRGCLRCATWGHVS